MLTILQYIITLMSHLTYGLDNKVRPQQRELRALLFSKGAWVLLRPTEMWTMKSCDTGSTVYRSYPRRLESLTIWSCNYKGSTFYSVIKRPWALIRPGFEPTTSPTRSSDTDTELTSGLTLGQTPKDFDSVYLVIGFEELSLRVLERVTEWFYQFKCVF